MHLKAKRQQRGLTLLEVMVALFIFAVTGSAILKAAGDHLGGVMIIQDITVATWVANNRLSNLQFENSWPPKNNQKGSEEMAGRTWYWTQTVEKTVDNELLKVEITVSEDEARKNNVTSVATFLAKSTAA